MPSIAARYPLATPLPSLCKAPRIPTKHNFGVNRMAPRRLGPNLDSIRPADSRLGATDSGPAQDFQSNVLLAAGPGLSDDGGMPDLMQAIQDHQRALATCTRCPGMQGPAVIGQAPASPVLLVGQAPGSKEIERHRPFAWTAGKTLFGWFERIGLDEAAFRERVYMSAICRCFPGKQPRGGDRVPNAMEIEQCSAWLARELELLQPRLILPAGKLAIGRFLDFKTLDQVVGRSHCVSLNGRQADLIPLPHPSGASTWHRTEPGKGLLAETLGLIHDHPAWQGLL